MPSISDKAFFKQVRSRLFGGSMTQGQVTGCQTILTAWRDLLPKGELRWLAYILATAKWETAHTMQPVAEVGRGKGRKYGQPDPETGEVYYGRGHVQLTWRKNYEKAGDKLGVDLVRNPDDALRPDLSAKILVLGMVEGWFTGRTLAEFLGPDRNDWKGARRIVNGTDRAAEIAAIGRTLHDCLLAASDPETIPDMKPAEPPPVAKSTTIWAQIGQWIAGGGSAALAAFTDWKVAAVFGAVAVLALGAWIIRERLEKRKEFGR